MVHAEGGTRNKNIFLEHLVSGGFLLGTVFDGKLSVVWFYIEPNQTLGTSVLPF